jgi:superkiller protein 3
MGNKRDSAACHCEIGNEHMLRKEWSLAAQAFRSAVGLDPQLQQAHAGLGAALGNQGLWSLAVDAHRNALMLDPDDVDVQYNLAVAYGELEMPVEAESGFRQVLERRPGDNETLVRLGIALAEQERFDEALQQFQAVALAEPTGEFTATACAYAAAAFVELDRTNEARTSLERARSLAPTLFEARPEFAQLWTDLTTSNKPPQPKSRVILDQ